MCVRCRLVAGQLLPDSVSAMVQQEPSGIISILSKTKKNDIANRKGGDVCVE